MFLFFKNLYRFICNVVRWVTKDILPVWATLGVAVLVAGVVWFLPCDLDDRVRYCGMALELLGILTVAYGLREKRRLFGRPSLVDHFKNWVFQQRPKWPVKADHRTTTISGSVGISEGNDTCMAKGFSRGASLEDRVTAIEVRLDTQEDKQLKIESQLNEEICNMENALDTERQSRKSALNKLHALLDTFGAGNLNLETIGVIWLVLGVILATIPSEIVLVLT